MNHGPAKLGITSDFAYDMNQIFLRKTQNPEANHFRVSATYEERN